ncbi:uncharacterized protein EI97DRAFT_441444 [Westerdykella ornata]|uniref:Uncharacterized protein n=1 Tax=Westerdykella ornata TaxID=318751 RepID=A0A6A6JLB6_WESOR|nr:uncharacterized protein EI97DRAFT_441444 [Westerdykella ornata]KAF2277381.1 hypothetical protein EI97DRAFT_441444 [Westerdykella ornata]
MEPETDSAAVAKRHTYTSITKAITDSETIWTNFQYLPTADQLKFQELPKLEPSPKYTQPLGKRLFVGRYRYVIYIGYQMHVSEGTVWAYVHKSKMEKYPNLNQVSFWRENGQSLTTFLLTGWNTSPSYTQIFKDIARFFVLFYFLEKGELYEFGDFGRGFNNLTAGCYTIARAATESGRQPIRTTKLALKEVHSTGLVSVSSGALCSTKGQAVIAEKHSAPLMNPAHPAPPANAPVPRKIESPPRSTKRPMENSEHEAGNAAKRPAVKDAAYHIGKAVDIIQTEKLDKVAAESRALMSKINELESSLATVKKEPEAERQSHKRQTQQITQQLTQQYEKQLTTVRLEHGKALKELETGKGDMGRLRKLAEDESAGKKKRKSRSKACSKRSKG